jgi:hypothetical protein
MLGAIADKTGGKLGIFVNNAGQLWLGPACDTDVQHRKPIQHVLGENLSWRASQLA